MTHKQQNVLVMLISSLLIGISTDFLFRQEIFGLNFALWSFMWVLIIASSAVVKKLVTPVLVLQLSLTTVNALLVYVRSEPIVQFWSATLTLVFMWLSFGRVFIQDYSRLSLSSKLVEWFISGALSVGHISRDSKKLSTNSPPKNASRHITSGIIVAIPLAIIFIALFASSDEIFRNSFSWLGDIFSSLAAYIDSFDLGRVFSIIFWSLLSLVWLGYVVYRRPSTIQFHTSLPKTANPRDITVVLGSVSMVFTVYVFIQLRYLFGGSSLPDGITYASYARRGYGELLAVTILASVVIYTAKSLSKEARNVKNRLLSFVLLSLNIVVVLSAWKRLSLYEDAYGWTMTRFVARMGLICIVLGSVTLLLWLLGYLSVPRLYRSNWYILTIVLMLATFLNPIGLVTKKNITDRSSREVELDLMHLLAQSPDSYPAICNSAQALRYSYPDEYLSLKTRAFKDNGRDGFADDNVLYSYPYKTKDASSFSQHYVYTGSFKVKYHNCLP